MEALKNQRARIDALDDQIVDLLVERFAVVREVGEIKKTQGIEVVQSTRADEVKNRVAARADAAGLDGNLLRAIYTLMIDHAHVLENKING